tara:strand:- start:1377 stop:2735 length:1359 start_codon:yes stop_codon:yes gene_type:complete
MKIIIFDDDPTGSQTVYGCPLLLRWDKETLLDGIRNKSPLLFILANTRSMSPAFAERRTRAICRALIDVFNSEGLSLNDVLFISRGDSTLRGHGVLEPKVIAEELGPFDGTFHVPAFFEGGRTTIDGIHFLNGQPVHLTEFASDKLFGYQTSYLPEWLEDKSKGQVLAENVLSIRLKQLDLALVNENGRKQLVDILLNISRNQSVVVDAQIPSQLSIFAEVIKHLKGRKRFLFRSAASLINAFANLPVNKDEIGDLVSLRLRDEDNQIKPGLVMVGSHVQLADEQLAVLLAEKNCQGIELSAPKIFQFFEHPISHLQLSEMEESLLGELSNALSLGLTPVLYTSRGEITVSSTNQRIGFGLHLAELMARLVSKIYPELGYIISKGGITTQILLEKGLNLGIVQLKGQILPGLSMICPPKITQANTLPIITFPGNLGDENTLLEAWELMERII